MPTKGSIASVVVLVCCIQCFVYSLTPNQNNVWCSLLRVVLTCLWKEAVQHLVGVLRLRRPRPLQRHPRQRHGLSGQQGVQDIHQRVAALGKHLQIRYMTVKASTNTGCSHLLFDLGMAGFDLDIPPSFPIAFPLAIHTGIKHTMEYILKIQANLTKSTSK